MFKVIGKKLECEKGFSIVETLVSLTISMAIFAGVTSQYGHISRVQRDLKIKETADRYSRTLLNIIGFDLRIVGNGIPFDQPDFQIGETGLLGPLADPSEVIQPIVLSSLDNDDITLRLSENGDMFVVMSEFNPLSSLNIVLSDVSSLEVGDKIYISNGSVARDDGFYGEISYINSGTNTITIDSNDYSYSPTATFPAGSLLLQVSDIRYQNTVNGITRTIDSGTPLVLAPNSTFSLKFLDYDGNEIVLDEMASPPMTEEQLGAELATIEVTVTMQGRVPLSEDKDGNGTGDTYTATARQIFSLRNLNIVQDG